MTGKCICTPIYIAAGRSDLNEAISLKMRIARSTPDDHPNRAFYLDNLGIALAKRYKFNGDLEDLDLAN